MAYLFVFVLLLFLLQLFDILCHFYSLQVTDLLLYGKIETTEARAKEVKAIADSIISLAVKEKDNFELVDAKVVKAKLINCGKQKQNKKFLKLVLA